MEKFKLKDWVIYNKRGTLFPYKKKETNWEPDPRTRGQIIRVQSEETRSYLVRFNNFTTGHDGNDGNIIYKNLRKENRATNCWWCSQYNLSKIYPKECVDCLNKLYKLKQRILNMK